MENTAAMEHFRQRLQKFIDYFCSKSNRLYFDKNKFDLVFSYYNEYERKIHEAMVLSINLDKKDKNMDRHKVATAFLCSIIKAKPIGYNTGGSLPSFLERTANEQLSFVFGLYVIDLFNMNRSVTAVEKEVYRLPIRLPKCKNNNDNDYATHFVKLIYDEKVKENLDFERNPQFNITLLFFLSHIFFLIDSFSYYRNLATLEKSQ